VIRESARYVERASKAHTTGRRSIAALIVAATRSETTRHLHDIVWAGIYGIDVGIKADAVSAQKSSADRLKTIEVVANTHFVVTSESRRGGQ
jgi:hypothetical protein